MRQNLTGEWRIGKEMKGSCWRLILRYFPNIRLGLTSKTNGNTQNKLIFALDSEEVCHTSDVRNTTLCCMTQTVRLCNILHRCPHNGCYIKEPFSFLLIPLSVLSKRCVRAETRDRSCGKLGSIVTCCNEVKCRISKTLNVKPDSSVAVFLSL